MDKPAMVGLAGQHLGSYQMVELIGTGGRAAIYKAYQPALGRYVAVKVLPPELVQEGFAARFRREAAVAARLEHPNILGVHDFGEHQGRLYIAMPYIAGGSLAEHLNANPPPARDWALRILLQVCAALAYAHRQGVVHGAVKPGNILLREENWAVLADFGIARLLETTGLTAMGRALSTPEYLAPEQAEGLAVDYRADLYAVGMVLYRVLASELPYSGAAATAMLQRAPSPAPGLPSAAGAQPWSGVLARALAQAPRDRYQSMEELAAAIQAAMHQERALAPGAAPGAPSPHAMSGTRAARAPLVAAPPPPIRARGEDASRGPQVPDRPEPRRAPKASPAAPESARRSARAQPRPPAVVGYRVRAAEQPAWQRPSVLLPSGAVVALIVLGDVAVRPAGSTPPPPPTAPVVVATPATGQAPAGTATPSHAEGRVLLQDDFADSTSGWPLQSSDPSTRRVGYVDGEYSIVKLANSQGAPLVIRDGQFGDFLYEIDMRLLPPTTDAYAYLDFRRQENGDHYSFIVDPNDGTYRLQRTVGRERRDLIDWTKTAAINQGTARNRLGVRAQGADIVLLVNGQEVGRVRDDTLRDGSIAFGVGNLRDGSADARFGNLLVATLPPAPS